MSGSVPKTMRAFTEDAGVSMTWTSPREMLTRIGKEGFRQGGSGARAHRERGVDQGPLRCPSELTSFS